MAFKITAEPTFEEVVELPHYRWGKAEFKFKFVPPGDIEAFVNGQSGLKNTEKLDQIIESWDVKDDDGAAVPYSIANLATLLDSIPCANRIYAAWAAGVAGARAKNL